MENANLSPVYPWQQEAWQNFTTLLDDDCFTHALMITTTPGNGLSWFAACQCRHLLNLSNPPDSIPGLGHPDLLWIRRTERLNEKTKLKKTRSKILIDQIRPLASYLSQKPSGKSKVVVIELAEDCNEHAANALLKPLEEPASNSHIILLSYALGRVLPTIRSRCVQLKIGQPTKKVAKKWLPGGNEEIKEWALWLTAGAAVSAQKLIQQEKINELLALDQCLAEALEFLDFDHSLIKAFAAQPPMLVNQFFLRLLLNASGAKNNIQPKAAAVLKRLPAMSLHCLVKDCLRRRKALSELADSLNHELLLANQIALWFEALRELNET